MAVRQTAVQRFIHECRIIEDDTSTADTYGHNASFSGAVRASNVACRYYEDTNDQIAGEVESMVTIAKLLLPHTQGILAEDRIDSLVHKGTGTTLATGTWEIISLVTRPTHKTLTIRRLIQN